MDGLEDGEGKCPVEATAIPTRLAVLGVVLVQVLDLDVEAFVIDELVEHE